MKKQRALLIYRTYLFNYVLDIACQNGMRLGQIYAQRYRFNPSASL